MNFTSYRVPYPIDKRFEKRVAYFSMEFAIHQPLKIYSGGLGFLAGSHLRSAYELRQNLVGIGILWKYGYYDQARNQDQSLQVTWDQVLHHYPRPPGLGKGALPATNNFLLCATLPDDDRYSGE
jgi:starch phosphorylase